MWPLTSHAGPLSLSHTLSLKYLSEKLKTVFPVMAVEVQNPWVGDDSLSGAEPFQPHVSAWREAGQTCESPSVHISIYRKPRYRNIAGQPV